TRPHDEALCGRAAGGAALSIARGARGGQPRARIARPRARRGETFLRSPRVADGAGELAALRALGKRAELAHRREAIPFVVHLTILPERRRADDIVKRWDGSSRACCSRWWHAARTSTRAPTRSRPPTRR